MTKSGRHYNDLAHTTPPGPAKNVSEQERRDQELRSAGLTLVEMMGWPEAGDPGREQLGLLLEMAGIKDYQPGKAPSH